MDDVLRFLALSLAIGIGSWLVVLRLKHPEWYPKGGIRRDTWSITFTWCLALIASSTEELIGVDTYLRLGFALAALLTTLAMLIRPASAWTNPHQL